MCREVDTSLSSSLRTRIAMGEHERCGRSRKLDRLRREKSCLENPARRRKTMSVQRKRYSAELKTRVVLEAIKRQKTATEIAAEYAVHPTQIAQWKKQALDSLPEVFSPHVGKREKSEEALIASLSQHIGQ
jgi:transposase-like protein